MKTGKTLLLICCLVASAFLTKCKKDNDDAVITNPPYIAGMQPVSGPRGTLVTLTGSNFSNDISKVTVYLNSKRADVLTATATTILFEVPQDAGDGPVSVVVNGTGAPGPLFDYIYTVTVSSFSGYTLMPGFTNGSAAAATFNAPRGITIDHNNNVYVADEQNHCIRRISPGGSVITFAGTGIAGHQDGIAQVAKFNSPYDIVFDPVNNYFYVADKGNHCIRKISLTGDVVTIAGIPGSPGYVDAPGPSARFVEPTGVAVTGELPMVFIADGGNHCIRKLDDVGIVTTFAGSLAAGQLDGTGTGASFNLPYDITWDTAGYLVVTDIVSHNVRRISENGVVTTLAGTGIPGYQDGPGSLAIFNSPCGIISENNLRIVCDALNHRLRMIESNGMVTTIAGDGTPSFLNGTGIQTRFNQPGGIVRDSYGDYFIADTGNNTVRRMVID